MQYNPMDRGISGFSRAIAIFYYASYEEGNLISRRNSLEIKRPERRRPSFSRLFRVARGPSNPVHAPRPLVRQFNELAANDDIAQGPEGRRQVAASTQEAYKPFVALFPLRSLAAKSPPVSPPRGEFATKFRVGKSARLGNHEGSSFPFSTLPLPLRPTPIMNLQPPMDTHQTRKSAVLILV